jgi:hypothetical protein
MADALHIQPHRAVDIRQRRHEGRGEGEGLQTETLLV